MKDQDIICGCNQISVKDVKDQIQQGVKSFKDLQDKTSIGLYCPPCKETSEQVFEQLLKEEKL